LVLTIWWCPRVESSLVLLEEGVHYDQCVLLAKLCWPLPCFQGKPFNITVIQVYALTTNAEEAEIERFYDDLQDLLELTPKKGVLFIIGDWNAKVGSQEIPGVTVWQVWPWSTKWSRAKVNRVLPREHTGHSEHPLPTTQETTLHVDITRWSIPKSTDFILCR